MDTADPCSITVRFRLGWRWHVAEALVRALPFLGVRLGPCIWVLNWGLSGSELRIGNGGWVPADLLKVKIEDIA